MPYLIQAHRTLPKGRGKYLSVKEALEEVGRLTDGVKHYLKGPYHDGRTRVIAVSLR